MKKLYILAPSDRFNYGDLLFPHIVKHHFQSLFDEICICSVSKSDLSNKGALPTQNYKTLFSARKDDENYVIVAGGDSLCIEWQVIISFIDKTINYLSAIFNKFPKKCREYVIKEYIRLRYYGKTVFPFSIGKNEVPNIKHVFYNSLGGSWLIGKDYILEDKRTKDILMSVDYISVRDEFAQKKLLEHNIDNTLVADSAILMSEIFDDEYLKNHINEAVISYDKRKYIYFQASPNYAVDNYKSIADTLSTIARQNNVKICLCPIGTALGHLDQMALMQIAKYLPADIYNMIDNPSIWDIMYLIKHSKLYVGSSLHGTITAMSYNVPFIGYGAKKLKQYIETWTRNSELFVEVDEIGKLIERQINSPLKYDSSAQKQSVIQSFHKMQQIIENR